MSNIDAPTSPLLSQELRIQKIEKPGCQTFPGPTPWKKNPGPIPGVNKPRLNDNEDTSTGAYHALNYKNVINSVLERLIRYFSFSLHTLTEHNF